MNSLYKQIKANLPAIKLEEKEMPLMELHLCIFCGSRMTVDAMGHYCKSCDAYKNDGSFYVFERLYKGKTYRFSYDLRDQKFTLTNEDAAWDEQTVMTSDDLYLITPKNWEKKLPTILVFS